MKPVASLHKNILEKTNTYFFEFVRVLLRIAASALVAAPRQQGGILPHDDVAVPGLVPHLLLPPQSSGLLHHGLCRAVLVLFGEGVDSNYGAARYHRYAVVEGHVVEHVIVFFFFSEGLLIQGDLFVEAEALLDQVPVA